MERFRGYLGLVLAFFFILAGVVYYLGRPRPMPIEVTSPTPAPTPSTVVVYVSGAVISPGVYTLGREERVARAVEAAGGALEDADLERLNLAQRLYDEQHVHVPRLGEPASAGSSSVGPGQPKEKIDLNRATAKELEELPGIGPALSQRIVAYREEHGPFVRVEDLDKVSGIGPAILSQIKDLVVVR